MIELDGSYGEGGGALVRSALAFSAYTKETVKITNIRAGRKNPGLKAQHLSAIKLLSQICDAKTNDIFLGSTDLTFVPSQTKGGNYEIDIGTAGSISLLLQAIILPVILSKKRIKIIVKGGTCGKWQSSVDYLQNILLPQLKQFAKMDLKILDRGYYPCGGGKVELTINSTQNTLKPIILIEQGKVIQIRGIVNLSRELSNAEVGERIAHAAKQALRNLQVPVCIRVDYSKTSSIGGELLLWTIHEDDNEKIETSLTSSKLIEKGVSAETIGTQASKELLKNIATKASVDEYLADQLIPFMGLLPHSRINVTTITNHTKTNIWVAEHFLPIKFIIEGNKIFTQ